MKIDGRTLVSMWRRARNAVEGSGEILLGGVVRRNGYDCFYDGYSVCDFSEKAVHVSYGASQTEGRWKIDRVVIVNEKRVFVDSVSDCDTFEANEVLSVAEKIQRGVILPKSFHVVMRGGGSFDKVFSSRSFSEADEFAKGRCSSEMSDLRRRTDIARYVAGSVRNDEQRARELGEVMHYEYYNCDGHRYWVAVEVKY